MALPPSSKYIQRSADPVDDTERDSITRRLNEAFADGRISHDQYAADMDLVYAARTLGELVPVIERLPAAADNVPAIVEQGKLPAGQVAPSRGLVPAAIMVGVVGVTLLAMLLLLIAFLF
ncbi:MAG: DUF1707 domain-containing protein [Tessaracoccus sp.]|uniref:DUF1707 SHOCT-like domain-containing protein n=1 Tax=Tessaracoccus sp. TaxID=1971211 RepID=UPI001EBFB114|nr:DUF1707 domain-containing protein [Tessaracoccus sp.]MBK7819569.1 DUF1707 domain-containing protein [Tessaracoccus sp.]